MTNLDISYGNLKHRNTMDTFGIIYYTRKIDILINCKKDINITLFLCLSNAQHVLWPVNPDNLMFI